MSELIIFLVVGLALVVVLLICVRRGVETAASRREFPEARKALLALQLELPPRDLMDRIFASQDWDFVLSLSLPRIQRIFLRERKTVALSWLRHTRMKARRLMDFHLKAVRRNIAVSRAVEFELAINYILFLVICRILLGLIWLHGPFGTRRLVGYAASMGEHLALTFGSLLARLDPVYLDRLRADWLQRSAAS